jgi:hypothetical protein
MFAPRGIPGLGNIGSGVGGSEEAIVTVPWRRPDGLGSPEDSYSAWRDEPWDWRYGLLTWPIFVVIFGLAVSVFGPNLYDLYRLEAFGKQTQGLVTGFDDNNHEACKYTFAVGGRSYRGSGNGGCSGPARLDTFVRVTYLPSDPAVAEDGSPTGDLWIGSLVAFGIPTFGAICAASPMGWRHTRRTP